MLINHYLHSSFPKLFHTSICAHEEALFSIPVSIFPIDFLNRHEISCTLVSEEAGTKKIGKKPSDYYVVTDPVDGTTNAVHGLPFCAHVVAVARGPWLKNV